MGKGQPTSRHPDAYTELEVLLEAKNERIAELKAKLNTDSQHFEILCLREVDRKYTTLVDGLRKLIETLDTQCMNSHVTRQLRALLEDEGINPEDVDSKVSTLIEDEEEHPDLCNDEPSCCKPELEKRIAELEAQNKSLVRVEISMMREHTALEDGLRALADKLIKAANEPALAPVDNKANVSTFMKATANELEALLDKENGDE